MLKELASQTKAKPWPKLKKEIFNMCRQTIFNSSFMCFSLNGKKIKIIKGLLKLHSLNLIGILVSVDDNWLISYLKLPAVRIDCFLSVFLV